MDNLSPSKYIKSTPAKRTLSDVQIITTWCAVLAGLISLAMLQSVLMYAAALAGLLCFFFCKLNLLYPILMFLLPFSNIYKFNPDQVSIFSVLFAIFIVRYVFVGKISGVSLIAILIYFIYAVLLSGVSSIITIGTAIMGMVMIYFVTHNEQETNMQTTVIAYSSGIIFTSLLAAFKSYFPVLNEFIINISTKLDDSGEYADRFCGVQGNPNYYTMDVCLAMACIVVLLFTQRVKVWQYLFLAALSVFGIMSVSKSFLIVWIFIMVVLLWKSITLGASKFIVTLFAVVICIVSLYVFAGDSIQGYLGRFALDEGNTLDSITTGRTHIWRNYFDYIVSHTRVLLLGCGYGAPLIGGKGTHNTYIELLYTFGSFGGMLFIGCICCMINFTKLNKQYIILLPLGILLVRFMAIGILCIDNLWFYIALIGLLAQAEKPAQINQQASVNAKNPVIND